MNKKVKIITIVLVIALILSITFIVAPALYEVISTSTFGLTNNTEGTAFGARLTAPVLLMDFNEEPVGTRVRDNSVYGNDGVLP